ncbi:hypothetical protein C4D60_Mb01t09970 [Musa balbisiana]|uniref:LOB domain-containing protein n=1 Tax=Musa balbisiana TaxID=52838 RepID=A0A4S8JLY8_MUSBA|nr:hypothetical protein C4D60_Mb01t09970 [Musa balbisiana]
MASSSAQVPLSSSSASASPSATSSPCAACKFLRRKCQPDCVFAPYFPPDQPQKFVHVHRVFGASNVTKLLNELHPYQREDGRQLARVRGRHAAPRPRLRCVGVISILQHQLRQLQMDLSFAMRNVASPSSPSTSPPQPWRGPPRLPDFPPPASVQQPQPPPPPGAWYIVPGSGWGGISASRLLRGIQATASR